MTTLTLRTHTAPLRRSGLIGDPVHDALWRIIRADGDVVGYIERIDDPRGERFRARRLHSHRRFTVAGEFWSVDDAMDALRFG